MAEARTSTESRNAGKFPGKGGGDAVARPLRFSLADYKAIGLRLFKAIGEENLTLIAAGVSFYAMLALVPTMIALISVYGFVADPADMESLVGLLRPVVPAIAYAAA